MRAVAELSRAGPGGDFATSRRAALMSIATSAIDAASPDNVLPDAIASAFPDRPRGRTLVFGAGKAAARMAAAFDAAYPWPVDGLVVTRHGFGEAVGRIAVAYGGHPVPDQGGLDATAEIMCRIAAAEPEDRVVFLLSGGASALLTAPVAGVPHEVKRWMTRALVLSGASIHEINLVRSRLSQVKGGGLARLCPAPITTFAISDVVGDDPAVIGSGPTVQPREGAHADPLAVLKRYHITVSPEVQAALAAPLNPLPSTHRRERDRYFLVADATTLVDAAAGRAREMGIDVHVTWPSLEGDVARAAASHAAELAALAAPRRRRLIVSGGELTVAVGDAAGSGGIGLGGPNQEFVVRVGLAMPGWLDFAALSLDTDGIDGVGDAAGGFLDRQMLELARSRGVDPQGYLARHDSQGFLDAVDGTVRTGPTGTNVNDLRLVLAEAAPPGRHFVLDPDCD